MVATRLGLCSPGFGVIARVTPFPIATAEITALRRLCAILGKTKPDDENAKARKAKAEQLVVRLGGPVRVAVLGGPGSGKTSLVNFLIGSELIPHEEGTTPRPPIIIRYDEEPATVAGWWSGIEIAEKGLKLEAAAVHKPDFIEFRIPNPILQFIGFLEMPKVDDEAGRSEQIRWASRRADVVIWCTKASSPWSEADAQIWAPFAEKLYGRSLLAVTHVDEVDMPRESLRDQLPPETANLFENTVLIATTDAIKAAPEGRVTEPELWEASGGRMLATSVLSLARKIRQSEVEAAQRLLAEPSETSSADEKPVEHDVSEAETPNETAKTFAAETPPLATEEIGQSADTQPPAKSETTKESPKPALEKAEDTAVAPAEEPSEHAPESTDTNAVPPVGDGSLGLLQTHLDTLISYAAQEDSFRVWEFLNSVVEMSDEISDKVANEGSLTGDKAWLRSQLDDAFTAFNMMQMEGGEQQCLEAATLLLQLSRDFSWATATSEEKA